MIEKIENYIDKMPSLSTTVARVLDICNDPATSPAELNRVIALDPVLMGKVIQLVNSAYYGLPNQITSLIRAITLLGLNTVKNLALSTAVLGALSDSEDSHSLDTDAFWEHSLSVAVISKKIATLCNVPIRRREEYFISGLLHDVGKVAIAGCFLDKYFEAIEKANNEEIPLFEAEKSVFNFDHQNVGLLITNHWRLEGGIKDAIGHHHDTDSYEGEYKTMVYAVCIADYISMYLKIGNAGNTELIKPSDKVFEHLGISLEEIAAANEGLYAEIEKARVFLNLSH